MTLTSSWSVLVLSRQPARRLVAADAYRRDGAVVVEASTVQQAGAILRQLQFDMLAIDFFGLGVGVIDLLHDLGVDYPDTCISVIGPPVDSDVLPRFYPSHISSRPDAFSDGELGADDSQRPGESGNTRAAGLDRVTDARRQEQTDLQEDA